MKPFEFDIEHITETQAMTVFEETEVFVGDVLYAFLKGEPYGKPNGGNVYALITKVTPKELTIMTIHGSFDITISDFREQNSIIPERLYSEGESFGWGRMVDRKTYNRFSKEKINKGDMVAFKDNDSKITQFGVVDYRDYECIEINLTSSSDENGILRNLIGSKYVIYIDDLTSGDITIVDYLNYQKIKHHMG